MHFHARAHSLKSLVAERSNGANTGVYVEDTAVVLVVDELIFSIYMCVYQTMYQNEYSPQRTPMHEPQDRNGSVCFVSIVRGRMVLRLRRTVYGSDDDRTSTSIIY